MASNIIHYINERKKKQPILKSTFGSVFKNPLPKAGQLVDSLDLKGTCIGDAQVSMHHANFFENISSATYDDTVSLIKLIQNKVYTMYNIKLECESTHSIDQYKDKTIAIIGVEFQQNGKSPLSLQNVASSFRRLGLTFVELDPIESSFFNTPFDIAFNCLYGGADSGLQVLYKAILHIQGQESKPLRLA